MQQNKPSIRTILGSSFLWLCLVLSAIAYYIITLTIFLLPLRLKHKVSTSWSYIFVYLAKILCGVKLIVIGSENIIKTPCIIASNHQSMYETIAFNTIFPSHVWILKKELLRIPFFGWTIKTLSPIAIDRNDRRGSVAQILTQGVEKIKNGFYIMLYPEGTRIKPGNPIIFKAGAGRMASKLNLPIIPVSHNAGYVLPKHSFLLYPGTVTVIIGTPIYPEANDTPELITAKLQTIVNHNLQDILRN
jgi:1-acyl-sn-glycerol-3-phosphate acyltransferase